MKKRRFGSKSGTFIDLSAFVRMRMVYGVHDMWYLYLSQSAGKVLYEVSRKAGFGLFPTIEFASHVVEIKRTIGVL